MLIIQNIKEKIEDKKYLRSQYQLFKDVKNNMEIRIFPDGSTRSLYKNIEISNTTIFSNRKK